MNIRNSRHSASLTGKYLVKRTLPTLRSEREMTQLENVSTEFRFIVMKSEFLLMKEFYSRWRA